MEKEEINLVGQLLNSMLEAVDRIEYAKEQNDLAEFKKAKQAILSFQKEIDKVI